MVPLSGNSLIQLPAPFDCFLILYADKSMALSVKLTISIALLFPEPSTYSEKNNSVTLLTPLVVVPLIAVDCADLLFAESFAKTRML